MSEYVPTTEQVRTDYILAYSERESSQVLAARDFDRWLAEHDRQVQAETLREWADFQERTVQHLGTAEEDFQEVARWAQAARKYADRIEKGQTDE